MTYCIGWIYKNSVYLAADTAATSSYKPTSELSSFREYHAKTERGFVEESLIKIIPISNDCMVCYSGNVNLADNLIEFLKDNYTTQNRIQELLNSMHVSLGPFDKCTTLIIAMNGENGPKLFRWETGFEPCFQGEQFYQSGSMVSYHSELTPKILTILMSGNIPEERVLPILTGVIQSYGMHDNLIQQSIGGLIFGAYINHEGVHWQQDTSYILYAPKMTSIEYINAFVRDNAIVVNSSVTNATKCFMSRLQDLGSERWKNKWLHHIQEHINSNNYEYWVFLSKKEKLITVVNWPSTSEKCKYVSLEYQGGGKFDLGVSPELLTVLDKPMVDRGDGSIPFRLNYLNG